MEFARIKPLREGPLLYIIAGILRDNDEETWSIQAIFDLFLARDYKVAKAEIRYCLETLLHMKRIRQIGYCWRAIPETERSDERLIIPLRRSAITTRTEHQGINFHVSFGYHEIEQRFVECFVAPSPSAKAGTDFIALVADACIAISLLLQHGYTFAALSEKFGANTLSEEVEGPASLMGTICWLGAALDANKDEQFEKGMNT